ncbi:hypothetical protein QYP01_18205 [Pseudomonas aeruginosa]|nr:hypothetical protein [Pseudomonas aeruginosa]
MATKCVAQMPLPRQNAPTHCQRRGWLRLLPTRSTMSSAVYPARQATRKASATSDGE